MKYLTDFSPELVRLLPATHALLLASNLVVHPAVERITLEGSRGLGGHPRPDSDVDLSLVVWSGALPAEEPAREALLRAGRSSVIWRRSTTSAAVDCAASLGSGIIRRSAQLVAPAGSASTKCSVA